jgi:ferric-dicitrate binding protein FerR (iron transport regulator)
LENPDDQTKKLLQDEQAYTERPEDIRQLADAIWSDISTRLDTGSTDTAEAPVRRWRLAGPIAASTTGLLIIIAAITWQTHRSHHSAQSQSVPAVANLLVRQDLDRVNQTDRSQTVYLVDGSKVVLQPGAGIRHAAFLQKDKREVYLQGNAFFEVAKDARRPFYVYSGDLVVRVLGTSFKVATDKESGDITVLVTTGKVAVTRKTAPLPQPLILTTNQIAFYKGHSRDLVQLKAEKKDLTPDLIPTAPAISFNFDETPVEDIFQTLENAYGIPFHYDKATFSHCVLTTSLADESLEEKIRIICEAIGATYELKEDGIFLEGKPCK